MLTAGGVFRRLDFRASVRAHAVPLLVFTFRRQLRDFKLLRLKRCLRVERFHSKPARFERMTLIRRLRFFGCDQALPAARQRAPQEHPRRIVALDIGAFPRPKGRMLRFPFASLFGPFRVWIMDNRQKSPLRERNPVAIRHVPQTVLGHEPQRRPGLTDKRRRRIRGACHAGIEQTGGHDGMGERAL